MIPPPLPLLSGLLGADFALAGATWWGSELAGRDGLPPAIAVLLLASPLGYLVARYAPLPVSRWFGRRAGVLHVGSAADRALPRLRQLVIEVEQVVTTGNLVVTDVVPLDVKHQHDLRWFAGALAHGSADPVARAIAKLSGLGRPVDISEGPAHELYGAVDRHPVRFAANGVDANGVDAPVDQAVGTTVRVDVDLRPMGHITVADEVRRSAARCLSRLRDQGIEPILVSASLSAPELARIAEQVEVSRFHAGTDASTLATSLPHSTTGVLRAVATSGVGEVAGETTLPGEPGEDTVVRCASPSVDATLDAIRHVRRMRRARRVAQVCAVVAVVLAAPLAAAGLLPLTPAVAVAGANLLLVAAVAAVAVLVSSPAPATD